MSEQIIVVRTALFDDGTVSERLAHRIDDSRLYSFGRGRQRSASLPRNPQLADRSVELRYELKGKGVMAVRLYARVPEIGMVRITGPKTTTLPTGTHDFWLSPGWDYTIEVYSPALCARIELETPADGPVNPALHYKPRDTQSLSITNPTTGDPDKAWQHLLHLVLVIDRFPEIRPMTASGRPASRSATLGLCAEAYLNMSRQWPAKHGLSLVERALGVEVPERVDRITALAAEFADWAPERRLRRVRDLLIDEVAERAATQGF